MHIYTHPLQQQFKRYWIGATTHQFGTWLAQNTTLSNAERARAAGEMSEIVGVYEGWEKIVSNFVNPLLTHVDCKWWSINFFYRACNWKFCLESREHIAEISRDIYAKSMSLSKSFFDPPSSPCHTLSYFDRPLSPHVTHEKVTNSDGEN